MIILVLITTILMSPQKVSAQRQNNEIIPQLQPDLDLKNKSTSKLTKEIKDLKKELETLRLLKSEMQKEIGEMKSWELTCLNCLKSLPNIKITQKCVKSVLRASWDCM